MIEADDPAASHDLARGGRGDADRAVMQTRQLAREHIVPVAERGPEGRVDRLLVKELANVGLLPRLFPRALGGTAHETPSATELCVVREGLATESPVAETTFAVQGLGSYPILLAGSPEQQQRWIPGVARGTTVAAFALSEPDAGSDAAGLTLRAERDGDGYRLSGTKTWISHAPDADLYTVFARTTEGAGARGVTAFAVGGDADGLSGFHLDMMATHAIGTLEFDGVPVSLSDVIGTVDDGFRVAMNTLNRFRPSVGAAAVGTGQAALEIASRHAVQRHAFGRPIGDFQAVSHALAEMATRLRAARLLVRDAAGAQDEGCDDIAELAAMSKLYATEVAQDVVDAAIQVVGAAGLQAGHPLERMYREVRGLRIYEGTSEIQRTIISRQLLQRAEHPRANGGPV